MEKISGIYCIENIINNKKYIGQSSNIKNRWMKHRVALNSNSHHNRHLQSSWNKYGEKSFKFYIIEKCNEEDLDIQEEKWIKYYNSNKDGYNLDFGGKGTRGYKHTKNEIEKMRKIQNPLVVLQFDLCFNFISVYYGGISQISKEFGYTKECIKLRCNHSIEHMKPYKNSYWVYEEEFISDDFTWENYLNNIKIIDVKKNIKHDDRSIYQYDFSKNLIKIWNNISELKQNYNLHEVLMVCNHKKKLYSHCIWCFEGYDFSDGYFDDITSPYYNLAIENKKRKIVKLDKNTYKELEIFSSIAEATRCMGFKSHVNIIKAIKNNGTSGGYRWNYYNNNG